MKSELVSCPEMCQCIVIWGSFLCACLECVSAEPKGTNIFLPNPEHLIGMCECMGRFQKCVCAQQEKKRDCVRLNLWVNVFLDGVKARPDSAALISLDQDDSLLFIYMHLTLSRFPVCPAELHESPSGQSAPVATVRQREEVGAHLRPGEHRWLLPASSSGSPLHLQPLSF